MITLTPGEKLRIQRRRLHLNQTEQAKRLGVTQSTISAWECGNSLVPPHLVPKLVPTPGELSAVLRRRMGLPVWGLAAQLGVSHMTLIKRERDEAPNDEYLELLERRWRKNFFV